MVVLWACSRHWELDAPSPGDVLPGAGIRISGTLDDPAESDGARQSDADASPDYRITGSVVSARDFQADLGDGVRHAGTDVVLSVGGEPVLAQVPGPTSTLTLGSRVAVRGEVSVVADYEWDAFELPDTRRQWSIDDVRRTDAGEFLLLLRPLG